MPQQTAIIPPKRRDPWYRRLLASPRYLVLVVAGLLIFGGAAVFLVQQASDDGGGTPASDRPTGGTGGDSEQGADEGGAGNAKQPVVPGNVTVAVLNGTTVPGLAKQVGDEVESHGFRLGTVANTADQEQQRAESVVLFAPGHVREARAVNKRLGIGQREPIDAASQELAGDATVVVIAGADLSQ
jgi:LytR cell envelope-related transcriptional attenuator